MSPHRPATRARSRMLVFLLCGFAVMIDGYDLIVYGTIVPQLSGPSGEWQLTPTGAGQLGSAPLAGMLLGAIVIGSLSDSIGRRAIFLVCVAWFSAAMGFAALAPNPALFALARFVAGIGLGGIMPTAISLTIEYARPRFKSATNGLMFSGYSVGGVVAALIAIPVLPSLGWRAMLWIGVAAGVALLPVAAALLPESPASLQARGRVEEARTLANRFGIGLDPRDNAARVDARARYRLLFSERYRRGTLIFWLVTAMGLLLVYGLNTWLAKIMADAGYPISSALTFLIVLNAGAIVGTGLLGLVSDRVGPRWVTSTMFITGGVAILLLGFAFAEPVLMFLVAAAGACTIGTTILVNAHTALYYPPPLRATAIGLALGVGRLGAILGPIYGGLVVATGWGLSANFYAFALPALIGGIAVLFIPVLIPERELTAEPVAQP